MAFLSFPSFLVSSFPPFSPLRLLPSSFLPFSPRFFPFPQVERDKDQKAHKENTKKKEKDRLWQQEALKKNLWSKEHSDSSSDSSGGSSSGSSSGSGSSLPPRGDGRGDGEDVDDVHETEDEDEVLIETLEKARTRKPARSRKTTGTVSQDGDGADRHSDLHFGPDTSVDAAKERKSFMWEGTDIRTSVY